MLTCRCEGIDRLAASQRVGGALKELCLKARVPPLILLPIEVPGSRCVLQILEVTGWRKLRGRLRLFLRASTTWFLLNWGT